MAQLRNPRVDTPIMPMLFWISQVALVALAVIASMHGKPTVWPDWHISLTKNFAVLSAVPQALWVMAMLGALALDTMNKRSAINSFSPTYHRWYYIIKYAAVSAMSAGAIFAVMVAVYGWADRSILAALGALVIMIAIAKMRMSHWRPAQMWGQGEHANNAKLAGQHGFVLAYTLMGVLGLVFALAGGASAYDSFIYGLIILMYAAIGVYAGTGFIAWSIFFLVHLGLIRR